MRSDHPSTCPPRGKGCVSDHTDRSSISAMGGGDDAVQTHSFLKPSLSAPLRQRLLAIHRLDDIHEFGLLGGEGKGAGGEETKKRKGAAGKRNSTVQGKGKGEAVKKQHDAGYIMYATLQKRWEQKEI